MVIEDLVRDQLDRLKICKSMSPDVIYPEVLRKLADTIAKPHLVFFEKS